jgi:hypothetical protein
MGLPSPNTSRNITPRRSASWYLLPQAVQTKLRIRGPKVTRFTAVGNCIFQDYPYLTVVIAIFLWILLFVQTPAPASKWIGWGRHPASLLRNSTEPWQRPDRLELYREYEDGLINPLESEGYDDEEWYSEEEEEEWEEEEEEVPEWLQGYPNPQPERSPSHVRFMTIATMLKNQRRWLREWIEFNLMMGFEHIIIYDNGSEDEPYEILRPYVDQGLLTYIPWPPPSNPPMPTSFATRTERYQYQWLHDALETCRSNTWVMHKQGPCQLAAFVDAILRTNGGISRWLAIWDVDEFIFPKQQANMRTLAGILRRHFADTDHIRFLGSVFGTSGHIVTPERKPGSRLPALLTEEYTMRSELDRKNSQTSSLSNLQFMESTLSKMSRLKAWKFVERDCSKHSALEAATPSLASLWSIPTWLRSHGFMTLDHLRMGYHFLFLLYSSHAYDFSGTGMKRSLTLMMSELNSTITRSYPQPMLVASPKRTETLS